MNENYYNGNDDNILLNGAKMGLIRKLKTLLKVIEWKDPTRM